MVPKLVGVAALAALLASCATTPSAGAPASGTPRAVSSLPDFELASLEGGTVRLSDHLGRDVVVLAFWDTWCEPCKTELPHLERIYQARREKGLVILAISMDEPTTQIQVAPYVHESGFTFPVLLDTSGKAANLYNPNKSAPYTVVIGRDGTIASEVAGFEVAAVGAFEQRLDALLTATLP